MHNSHKTKVHKNSFFELKFILVLIRKTFRSPAIISSLIFGFLLYISFPLILIEAFDVGVQPSASLNYYSSGFKPSQEFADVSYSSIYYQIQVWSSLVRPIALISPVSLIINKLIVQPFKSGTLLIYVGTPIKKSSLLTISFLFTFFIAIILIITSESFSTVLSLNSLKDKLSPEMIAQSADQAKVESISGFSATNNLITTPQSNPLFVKVGSETNIETFTRVITDYYNHLNSLVPGSLKVVEETAWKALPYSFGMLLLFTSFSIPLSLLFSLKSSSRFSSLYAMFILSGSAVLFWGLIMPLSRLQLENETLLAIFTTISYLFIGMYPSFIAASAYRLAGFEKSSALIKLTSMNNISFDIVQEKALNSEITEFGRNNSFKSSPLYLPTENMVAILVVLLVALLGIAIWYWRKQDVT